MQVLYIWAHLGLAQRRHYFVTESPRVFPPVAGMLRGDYLRLKLKEDA